VLSWIDAVSPCANLVDKGCRLTPVELVYRCRLCPDRIRMKSWES
jgi:hypothetical protein